MKNILKIFPQDYGVKVLSDDAEGAVFNSSYPMFGVDIRNQQGFKTYKIHIANITESEPADQSATGYYAQNFTLATIPHGLGFVPAYYAFWNIQNNDFTLRTRARFNVRKTEGYNAGDYPDTYNAVVNGNAGFFHDSYQYPHYGKQINLLNTYGMGSGRYTTPYSRDEDGSVSFTVTGQPAIDPFGIQGIIYLEADENNIYVKMKLPYWVNKSYNTSWYIDGPGSSYITYTYSGSTKEWVSLVGSTITLTLFITPY